MSNKKKEYLEYLQSPEWQEKRQGCFDAHGRYCHLCKATSNLRIHHRTYKNLKHEDVKKGLIPLCAKHHKQLHKFCEGEGQTIWNGTVMFFKYYKRGGKQVSRAVRLRRANKKAKQKKKAPKKKKVIVNSESALEEFKETLRLIESEKHLSYEEKRERMKERVAKKRADRGEKPKKKKRRY